MPSAAVVLITGASRGIGAAVARLLLTAGHRVAAVARSREAIEAAMAEGAPSREGLLVMAGAG